MDKHDEAFCFGVNVSPWWFLQAVEQMHVEYVHNKGKVIGCRFYKHNKEITKTIGQVIHWYELYTEEPLQTSKPSTITYRHYSSDKYNK